MSFAGAGTIAECIRSEVISVSKPPIRLINGFPYPPTNRFESEGETPYFAPFRSTRVCLGTRSSNRSKLGTSRLFRTDPPPHLTRPECQQFCY